MCVGTLWNNYIKKPHNQRTKKIQRIKLNRNECTAKYTTLVIINVASMMRTRMLLCVFLPSYFFHCFHVVPLYCVDSHFISVYHVCKATDLCAELQCNCTWYLFASSNLTSNVCGFLRFISLFPHRKLLVVSVLFYNLLDVTKTVISTYHFFQSECHVFFFFHKNQMKQQQQ